MRGFRGRSFAHKKVSGLARLRESWFSIKLENVEFTIGIVEALNLGASVRTEVDEDSDGIVGGTEIAEGLVMLFLGQLRQGFALHDDVTD